MKHNLKEIYDDVYVDKIKAKQWRYDQTPRIVDVLFKHFSPSSVIDVGAANGLQCKRWRELGVENFGIEGTPFYENDLKENCDRYLIRDLRVPFFLDRKFDLVTNIEVLEHIEEPYADIAVENISRMGETFFITANPSRGGVGHFNPRPLEYWIEKFEKIGLKHQKEESGYIMETFKKIPCSDWYKNLVMIFRT